jgi:magnesium chelatase family protein
MSGHLAIVRSAQLVGIDGLPVTVEVHASDGIPSFTIVGQPDGACREARDRVRAAILTSGFGWPARRLTVNLAPTTIRKVGAGLDLAIAVGVLVADGQIPQDRIGGRAFVGELGLDGSVRRVPGIVPLVDDLLRADARCAEVILPVSSAAEATLLGRGTLRAVSSLTEVALALLGSEPWPDIAASSATRAPESFGDLADVRGQPLGRLALEVAAAGGHHLLLAGPPGAGKTMLASRLTTILPDLTVSEAIEVLRIHSAAGLVVGAEQLPLRPAFRAPHHTASAVALLGGGSAMIRPGELSCAHLGVLFLDEFGEFPPFVLDALRQPLEDGCIRIARAAHTVTLPAKPLVVAATNPCPCGWWGTSFDEIPGAPSCRCSDAARSRYVRRLAGPLLDRFDVRVSVLPPDADQLLSHSPGESSEVVAARVARVRRLCIDRNVRSNAELAGANLRAWVPLSASSRQIIEAKLRNGSLTGRGFDRVRRVARTIADLHEADPERPVPDDAVMMALELRRPVLPETNGLAA